MLFEDPKKTPIWEDGEYDYKAAYGFAPNIRPLIHEDDKVRPAMLVIPGGGYCFVTPSESQNIAEEFYKRGFNTFVLCYTVDITMSVPLKDQPIKDAVRAMRFIRHRAGEYKIDPNKITVCGFSAGGHVVGNLMTHHADVKDTKFTESGRPDAAIFAYPVITTGEFTHQWSVQALLGTEPSQDELDYYSVEKNIADDNPPCFIWQTLTDNLVPVENSYLLAKALKDKGIKYAHYVFPEGWHGLSLPNEDFFAGKIGGDFCMEQIFKAVDAVREGKGIGVSEKRRQELIEQFAPKDEGENKPPMPPVPPKYDDILMWPDLAMNFLERLELI